MKTPIRVAMIIPSYFPAIGGAERQLEALAPELSKHNIEITVITKQLANTAAREVYNGVTILRCPFWRWNWTFLLSLAKTIISTKEQFDVIHVHTINSPFFVAALLKGIHKSKVIVKIPRTGKDAPFTKLISTPLRTFFFKLLARNVDAFIALNSEAVSELEHVGVAANSIAELPNGVDTSFFTRSGSRELPSQAKQYGLEGKLILATSGRLIARKRVDFLLRAFAVISKEFDSARLVIIGGGPQQLELEELTAELNLGEKVIFTGKLSPADVRDLLQITDIYVSASCSEGMSNAILEAMSCGAVPLCAKIPGNIELIETIAPSLLFDANSLSELNIALCELLADSKKRNELSDKVVSKINTEYNISSIALRYNNLYRDLLIRND